MTANQCIDGSTFVWALHSSRFLKSNSQSPGMMQITLSSSLALSSSNYSSINVSSCSTFSTHKADHQAQMTSSVQVSYTVKSSLRFEHTLADAALHILFLQVVLPTRLGNPVTFPVCDVTNLFPQQYPQRISSYVQLNTSKAGASFALTIRLISFAIETQDFT